MLVGFVLVDCFEELCIVVDFVYIGECGYWEIFEWVFCFVIFLYSMLMMFVNSDMLIWFGGGILL